MLFHLSSKKYFEAISQPIFIEFFLYKEKYFDFFCIFVNGDQSLINFDEIFTV
jgi:hypothetical protein